ncbi:hypothetical protein BAUCODRAFT_556913 [Baudoinia panamericana UAMH 10762]|uniref:Uncharacterized protein n=1 Tax=Baudoinia panamericana (strain UAMH 10762) TaxID=717646 RepID=M2MDS0_BAUPA|nr:uncharacterized protein BAUCODRAFT_556913 [Baudoinia panamericana UAMH 10762]EMC94706.1 hypothetical protein BAUCODRAFT_556913 [Baudoinia panamericana UAMH 10762]
MQAKRAGMQVLGKEHAAVEDSDEQGKHHLETAHGYNIPHMRSGADSSSTAQSCGKADIATLSSEVEYRKLDFIVPREDAMYRVTACGQDRRDIFSKRALHPLHFGIWYMPRESTQSARLSTGWPLVSQCCGIVGRCTYTTFMLTLVSMRRCAKERLRTDDSSRQKSLASFILCKARYTAKSFCCRRCTAN